MSKRISAAAALLAVPVAVALSFSAFWRPKRAPEPADDPGILPPDDYRALLEILATYCSLRNLRATIEGGELVMEGPDGEARYALQGLADKCREQKRELWPQLVGRYFASAAPLGETTPTPEPGTSADEPFAPLWPDITPKAAAAPRPAEPAPPAPARMTDDGPEEPAPPVPPPATIAARDRVLAPLGGPVRQLRPLPRASDRAARAPEPAALAGTSQKGDVDADWAAFGAMVQACFQRYGLVAQVEADGVTACDSAGRAQRFEAPGMARVVRVTAREQWPRFIDDAFGEPLRRLRGGGARGGRAYAQMRDQLAVQLFDAAALSDDEREATIYREDLPGLLSAIVCRRPQGAVRVAPGVARRWGVTPEDVFAAALANMRLVRPPVEPVTLAPGMEGVCFEADDELLAGQALLVGEDPRCSGRFGSLLALPRSGLMLACPLHAMPEAEAEAAVSAALAALVLRIRESQREGHSPLSRSLYWYRDGSYTELRYEVQMEGGEPVTELYPPAAFLAALAEMAKG